MISGIRRLVVAFALAIPFAAGLPAVAQTPPNEPQLCPAGQEWVFHFKCNPVTLKCHIEMEGCEPVG